MSGSDDRAAARPRSPPPPPASLGPSRDRTCRAGGGHDGGLLYPDPALQSAEGFLEVVAASRKDVSAGRGGARSARTYRPLPRTLTALSGVTPRTPTPGEGARFRAAHGYPRGCRAPCFWGPLHGPRLRNAPRSPHQARTWTRRPGTETMEEGEEGRCGRLPQAALSRTRPTREVVGTCRRSRAARQSPPAPRALQRSLQGDAPPALTRRAALGLPSPWSVPAGPGAWEAGLRQRLLPRPPRPLPASICPGEQMWAPAVTGCICSVPFTGIQTRPQWAAFVRGH